MPSGAINISRALQGILFDRCAVHDPFRSFDADLWQRLLCDPVDGRPRLRNALGFPGAPGIDRPFLQRLRNGKPGKRDLERLVVVHQVNRSDSPARIALLRFAE